MRHKPGSRCTVRYDLDLDPATSGAPTMVVAKTYRGDKGANAFAGMQALWDAPSRPGEVALAEPIAYRHDLRLLVQGPVEEERTLKDLVRSTFAAPEDERATALDAVGAELAKAADGLAALHDSGIEHGEVVTWEEELGDVRNLIARLRGRCPARRTRSRRSSTGSRSAAAGRRPSRWRPATAASGRPRSCCTTGASPSSTSTVWPWPSRPWTWPSSGRRCATSAPARCCPGSPA